MIVFILGSSVLGSRNKVKIATVTIQHNWLYRTKVSPLEAVTLSGDGSDFDKMVNGIRQFEAQNGTGRVEHGKGKYAAVRVNNYVPLISRHCVHIKMTCEDAKKCKAMLDLTWALSVIAAIISGAAEWPDRLPDQYDYYNYDSFGDDDDEIDVKTTVEQWLYDLLEVR